MHAANRTHIASVEKTDLLSPSDIERDYAIPQTTQAVWRCHNRIGFGDLVIKLGSSVRYKRADVERWLESRRVAVTANDGGAK